MWPNNRLTEALGLRYPIIQGPFGGGLSTVRLTAAVSEAGGLGSFGAHLLRPAEISRLAAEIRAVTDKPFALNLWVSSQDPGADRTSDFEQASRSLAPLYARLGLKPAQIPAQQPDFEAQAAAVIEAGPRVFSFVFGIPAPHILAACRERGIFTLGAATSLEEALALEQAGVDGILATGFEAGGHRPAFLRPAEASLTGTLALVPQIVDRVNIPVIAAGGIGDGRGIAAILMLGAQAAQIGSAFLACEESGTLASHRAALLSEAGQRTVLTRALTGRLARFIPNRLLETLSQEPALPYPLQSWLVAPIKQAAARRDDAEHFSLYAGQASPLLRHTRAPELMQALISQTESLLSRRFEA